MEASTNSKEKKGKSLEELNFDNASIRELPLDKVKENFIRPSVANALFSRVSPTPVNNPKLIAVSEDALALLDVDVENEVKRADFAEFFSGNKLLNGSECAAHCYAGHQFGNFAGQLGDGRAILLGEIVNHDGKRYELQFKGAGKTPYSRSADGRAVLRSSIREFLCSEFMYHVGIPTTRAGTLVTSDTYVVRDIRYNGNPIRERATIVLRIAPTFLRFGSFQIALPKDERTGRSGPSPLNVNLLRTLLNYVIKYHYPQIDQLKIEEEDKWVALFREVVLRTARMVAEWQCIGFTHGVMNTDNMSILGLTIDYGPFGFLDSYNPDFISNATDEEGRYSFKNQPSVCKWNLERLADALSLLLDDKHRSELEKYDSEYERAYMSKMRRKLGLFKELAEDKELVESLLRTMRDTGGDFTNIFRSLSSLIVPTSPESLDIPDPIIDYLLTQLISQKMLLAMHTPKTSESEFQQLMTIYEREPRLLMMMGGNSVKFLKEEMIRRKRYEELSALNPDERRDESRKKWVEWVRKYKMRLLLEIEGSESVNEYKNRRVALMNSNNPKYILRNYLAQQAIEKAEKGDYSEVHRIHQLLKNPYEEQNEFADGKYDATPPDWASDICVT